VRKIYRQGTYAHQSPRKLKEIKLQKKEKKLWRGEEEKEAKDSVFELGAAKNRSLITRNAE
jgi:hypothetical protein